MSDGDFLSRWSRRKHEARRQESEQAKAPPPVPPEAPAVPLPASAPGTVPAETAGPAPLPPVESLTPESDFTPFMQPNVDPGLRQQALKTLFQDARYNVMDGLDVYIGDYTKADPLPEGWLEKMESVARLGVYRPPVEDDPGKAGPAEALEGAVPAPEHDALASDAGEAPELLNTVPAEVAEEPIPRREPQPGGT